MATDTNAEGGMPPLHGNTVNNDSEGIMGSIAALKQILMIDTPTKGLLSEKQTTIALQQTRNEERKKYKRIRF